MRQNAVALICSLVLTGLTGLAILASPAYGENPGGMPTLTGSEASRLARLSLKGILQEYPNKLDHVMSGPDEVENPRTLHPAFFGCYDWHSSVHGHWMLVRLLKLYPQLPEAGEIRAALRQNLTGSNIQVELEYMGRSHQRTFERPYGWAWLLKLAEELRTWDDPESREWSANLQPLADAIVERYVDYLPRQTYPTRSGAHSNTAFGLSFALDYARSVGHEELAALVAQRSRDYYAKDADYPAEWEPGGEDFFSPCLIEADLMRRVLKPAEFSEWFHRFLPGVSQGRPETLLVPAIVADRSDPRIVHLDGLNLSRAWCMRGIAAALAQDDPARGVLLEAATRHAREALPHVTSGDYAGEHWLATFALYMLSAPGEYGER